MKVNIIIIMFICGTFAHLRNISSLLEDPNRGSRAMHNLLCSNVKLTRKVLTKNLLRSLTGLSVGTNEVEIFATIVCKQNVRKGRNKKLIRSTMRFKLEDAELDEKSVRKKFVQDSIEYRKVIRSGTFVDIEFKRIMKTEVECRLRLTKK